ncbi:hypothetical protein OB13_18455 [Pontibacter sp. HJ8]
MSTPTKNGIFAEHYLLKERFSIGKISEVWRAEDWTSEGAIVAVKIFTPDIRLDNFSLEQLSKEQEALASLDHPYLLQPFRFDIFEGIPYLVMPYLAQGSLSRKLLEGGPLPEEEIAFLLTHIAGALDYLHTRQPPIIHKQVSPDNILISDNDSYLLSAPEMSSSIRNIMFKATGNQYSPATAYAAPELFRAHPVHSTASDIFSLGVVLYELCTGEVPWLGNGGVSLLKGAEVPYLPNPYSRILSNLVRACLHPDPEKRPTARLLADEATYYNEYGKWKTYGSFGSVTAESIVYKKRSPLLPVILITLLVLGALVAAYFYVFNGKLPDKIAATFSSTSHTAGQAAEDTAAGEDTRTAKKIPTATATNVNPKKPVTDTTPVTQKTRVTRQDPAPAPAVKKPEAVKKPPVQRSPSYPRPTSLEAYLKGMLNEEIPLEVRDQWKPAIRRYFAPDAIVYATMDASPLGSFGVAEFMDILLSTENASISVENIIRDEEDDKIDELNVNLTTVEATLEQDSLE